MNDRIFMAGMALSGIIRDYDSHDIIDERTLAQDFDVIVRDTVMLGDAVLKRIKDTEPATSRPPPTPIPSAGVDRT